MESLESWVVREYRHAAREMLASISPLDTVKRRPGFGQSIRAERGAIVASPILAAYDPDPDYFFHWYRDSALVVDALRCLHAEGLEPRAAEHFADFVRFSVALAALDGRRLLSAPAWRAAVQADFVHYLRPEAELAAAHGEAIAAETRVNPDGTLDISRWARPQHDGPALRALAVLRWSRSSGASQSSAVSHSSAVSLSSSVSRASGAPRPDPAPSVPLAQLLRADLAYTLAHGSEPCYDIWEEELGLHYYTLRVAAAALEEGAEWLDSAGEPHEAAACRAQAARLLAQLDGFWLQDAGFLRSRILPSGARSTKELDISVVLAVIHAFRPDTSAAARDADRSGHCVHDPRIHATLARLEALFEAEYPINQDRAAGRAPALGRYAADRYYSGGAYYFATLAAAELNFRAAAAVGQPRSGALLARGNAYLETVRAFTPASGDLSEQFDRQTGAQTSAKQLAWSYAAFITCVAAKRAAEQAAAHRA